MPSPFAPVSFPPLSALQLKLAYSRTLPSGSVIATELKRALAKGETSLLVGVSGKLKNGAGVKAVIATSGLLNTLYTQELAPATTLAVSAQWDTTALDKNAKLGVSLTVKT